MPSLFIWKAASPLPLTSTSLTYYSGSDWFLEEHSTYSKSAMYLNQQTLSNHGWLYDIKWMPTNWVGSHLLENITVPYLLLKEDVVGRLEQLGDWMRFTSYHEVDDKEAEWKRIQEWVLTNDVKKSSVQPFVTKVHSQEPCLINLSANYSPVSHINNSRPIQNYHHSRQSHKHAHRKKRIVA